MAGFGDRRHAGYWLDLDAGDAPSLFVLVSGLLCATLPLARFGRLEMGQAMAAGGEDCVLPGIDRCWCAYGGRL
jgi:hypothetical protein